MSVPINAKPILPTFSPPAATSSRTPPPSSPRTPRHRTVDLHRCIPSTVRPHPLRAAPSSSPPTSPPRLRDPKNPDPAPGTRPAAGRRGHSTTVPYAKNGASRVSLSPIAPLPPMRSIVFLAGFWYRSVTACSCVYRLGAKAAKHQSGHSVRNSRHRSGRVFLDTKLQEIECVQLSGRVEPVKEALGVAKECLTMLQVGRSVDARSVKKRPHIWRNLLDSKPTKTTLISTFLPHI